MWAPIATADPSYRVTEEVKIGNVLEYGDNCESIQSVRESADESEANTE
jgi:hypothetical protein